MGVVRLAPIVANWIGPALQDTFGFLPVFQGTIYGVNMLTAALILALMIVPTITAESPRSGCCYPDANARGGTRHHGRHPLGDGV